MTSAIDICNQALAAIGARSTISSLTEDSPEARQCNLQYSSTLKQVLRAAHWGFARKYQALSVLKAAPGTPEATTATESWDSTWPPPPWLYSYAQPSDCLQMRYLMGQPDLGQTGIPIFPTQTGSAWSTQGAPIKWIKAQDDGAVVICSNEPKAVACYTFYADQPDMWDPTFVQAVIAAVAAQLAMPLTGATPTRKNKVDEANALILEARARDGNEGLTIYDRAPDWIRARGYLTIYDGIGGVNGLVEPYGPLFQ